MPAASDHPYPISTQCTFLFAVVLLLACGGRKVAEDPCCQSMALPQGVEVKSGQGALQVDGATTSYFYVFDKSGKQVNYQLLNKTLSLGLGSYEVKVNNSIHEVFIEAGKLTKCSTGTLLIQGLTPEYYYVLDSANQQLTYETLGKAISLFASSFRVKVNGSETDAEVKLNAVTEIKTGAITVRGTTGEYYYVFNNLGTQLNYNSIQRPLAFFPGSYSVKVNNTKADASVKAGQLTELTTGTIVVKGLTEEYYYVLDSLGTQLNYQILNKPLAFFPGSLQIKVNGSIAKAKVIQSQISEYATGSLIVNGSSGEQHYYVLDAQGIQLNYNSLNKPLSFFPADYSVRLGERIQNVTVSPGQQIIVH